MSKTFMRGLQLLEAIDLYGPITVTELARHTGMDKSAVSRMLSACEPDGWIARSDGRIVLGQRAALLAHSSPAAAHVRAAGPLVEAISGVTGFHAQAYMLIGSRGIVIASAGAGAIDLPVGLGTSVPLWATAAGKVLAAQLAEPELDRLLPPDPLPDPADDMRSLPGYDVLADWLFKTSGQAPRATAAVARDRVELRPQLEAVREDGTAREYGELHPELACIAVPWVRAGATLGLACMGSPAELRDGALIARAVLGAAAAPGATRTDIAAAASR